MRLSLPHPLHRLTLQDRFQQQRPLWSVEQSPSVRAGSMISMYGFGSTFTKAVYTVNMSTCSTRNDVGVECVSLKSAHGSDVALRPPLAAAVPAVWNSLPGRCGRPHRCQLDPGAVEFRRLTASNFHGVEVVDWPVTPPSNFWNQPRRNRRRKAAAPPPSEKMRRVDESAR